MRRALTGQPGGSPPAGARARRRRSRRGLSLMEIMVVMAILLVLIAVLVPGLRSLFELNQRSAARKLAVNYQRLHDEAVMRNRTYRIAFYLDEDRYVVEAGEPGALISASPEDRERHDAEVKAKLRMMDEEQIRAWKHSNRQPFESLGDEGRMEVHLPSGVHFGGFYSPQYGRIIRPGDELEGREKDEPLIVWSYVMSNGYTEHTLVWLVDEPGGEDGWTVEVQPLSGVVELHGELLQPTDTLTFLPQQGPSLPN